MGLNLRSAKISISSSRSINVFVSLKDTPTWLSSTFLRLIPYLWNSATTISDDSRPEALTSIVTVSK
jgi:hypothetical protein